jgi:hypothetical protein
MDLKARGSTAVIYDEFARDIEEGIKLISSRTMIRHSGISVTPSC